MSKSTITGYVYIDESVNDLVEQLPEELHSTAIKTLKDIYSAGKAEGIYLGKIIQKEKQKS
jgi:hypothetical protein